MTANPWDKFFWNDWENDPALKLCGLAAQGLWMRILCICAKADPKGYLIAAGRPLSPADLSSLVGKPVPEVETLLCELSNHGVFSTDRTGRIYSRRMVRAVKKARTASENGKKGGNPSLSNHSENSTSDNRQLKPDDKPHKPRAISQCSSLRSEQQPAMPDWLPVKPWADFLEVRKKQRVPNTPSALALLLKKLGKFRDEGADPANILNQSVERGWKGLFPMSADQAPRQSQFPQAKILKVV